MIDPANPIVQLCAQGMQAETRGHPDEASALYMQAWQSSADDYEACIAAHYVARQQDDPNEMLRWNQIALDRADAAGDERVRAFYPSLLLNLGRC